MHIFITTIIFGSSTPKVVQKHLFSYASSFLQICVNLQKYWCNAMSNDGLTIEDVDLSHIHLAVSLP